MCACRLPFDEERASSLGIPASASASGGGARTSYLLNEDDEEGAGRRERRVEGASGGERGLCAEVLTAGGKREAMRECALEACRLLDKLGELDPNRAASRTFVIVYCESITNSSLQSFSLHSSLPFCNSAH